MNDKEQFYQLKNGYWTEGYTVFPTLACVSAKKGSIIITASGKRKDLNVLCWLLPRPPTAMLPKGMMGVYPGQGFAPAPFGRSPPTPITVWCSSSLHCSPLLTCCGSCFLPHPSPTPLKEHPRPRWTMFWQVTRITPSCGVAWFLMTQELMGQNSINLVSSLLFGREETRASIWSVHVCLYLSKQTKLLMTTALVGIGSL